MSHTVDEVLRTCEFRGDEQSYRLLKLPANGITVAAGIVAEASLPFTAMLADQHEVTMLLPDEVCQEFQRRLKMATVSDALYRLITVEAVLEPDLVGLIARVSRSLAESGIPVLVFAAYSRDHIFVPVECFDKALAALRSLQESMQQ
ncbi:MAG: ACT domain-containing protein [Chloroflexi bacterium]|nr:ACT domain-containing protein [Chloroflexota bacterium]